MPKAPRKIIPTFSEEQLASLFKAIDTSTPAGLRDLTLIHLYLDTIARLSEVTNLKMADLDLGQGIIKIRGKGDRERRVPFGITVRKMLWKYINQHRPVLQLAGGDYLFLTLDGRHLSNNRLRAIVKKYADRAGITGVRASPHTLRHTGCLYWVRNGGDLFSLQQITGHSSLAVLRGYVNLSESDVREAHRQYSPVDNLKARLNGGSRP
ncbi:tyrosine-type recombinase/integrase [Chloroflexota bacterium]